MLVNKVGESHYQLDIYPEGPYGKGLEVEIDVVSKRVIYYFIFNDHLTGCIESSLDHDETLLDVMRWLIGDLEKWENIKH